MQLNKLIFNEIKDRCRYKAPQSLKKINSDLIVFPELKKEFFEFKVS